MWGGVPGVQCSERAPLPSPKDLVNIEMFLTAKEVEESLERRETATCLAWCHDNKSRLRKMKVRGGGEGGALSPGWQGRRLGAGGAPDWVGLGAGRAGHGLRGGAEAALGPAFTRWFNSLVLALGWGGCVWCGFGVILVVHLLLRYGLDQCSEREFLREEVPTTCKHHGSHCWGGSQSSPSCIVIDSGKPCPPAGWPRSRLGDYCFQRFLRPTAAYKIDT